MTYKAADFKAIAETGGMSIRKVAAEKAHFEAAAMFYRRDEKAPKRTPPSKLRPKLKSVQSKAKQLLQALEIYEPETAADGPPLELLEILASHSEINEEGIVLRATDRVGMLVEILNALENAMEAAKDLERYSGLALKGVETVRKPMTTPGNKGNEAVNNWIAEMLPIYERISGKPIGTSVASPTSKSRGKAGGPLIRFLTASGAPLEIENTEEAWRSRIRSVQKSAAPVD